MSNKLKLISSSKSKQNAPSKKTKKEKTEKGHEKLRELKLQLITIETDLENEKKQRNKLQIERDKLQQFWDISRDQAKQIKQELFDKTHESNETNGTLQRDIAYLTDKIAFLMRDHERVNMQINESQISNDIIQTNHSKVDEEAEHEIWLGIKEDQKNLLLEKETELENIKKEYEKIIELNKEAFENEKRILKSSSTKHHQEELRTFKLAKIQQFDNLLLHHQTQIQQLQESYDSESKKYQDEIDMLKHSISSLNEKCTKTDHRYLDAVEENSKLKNQIEILNKTTENFLKDFKSFEGIKRDAEMYRKQFKQTKTSLQEWKENYEILHQNCRKIEKERDQLYFNFQEAIKQIHQQASQQKDILNQQIDKAEQNIIKGKQWRKVELTPAT